MKYFILKAFLVITIFFGTVNADTCIVYFTGIGCPHCAKTDPVIFGQLYQKYNVTIIEYEVYQKSENARYIYDYNNKYNTGFTIPLLIFSKSLHIVGDRPILNNIDKILSNLKENKCLLLNESVSSKNLDISNLPGKPTIWHNNAVIIPGSNQMPDQVRYFLETNKLSVKNNTKPIPITLSGSYMKFEKAANINGWIIEWERKNNGSKNNVPLYSTIIFIVFILLILIYIKKRR